MKHVTLQQLLAALNEGVSTSSAGELKHACELIIDVQAMDNAQRDCICAAYTHGPLFDGDVPCKTGRDNLIDKGYMAKIVVRCEDGYNACTHKGARAYRLIAAGA